MRSHLLMCHNGPDVTFPSPVLRPTHVTEKECGQPCSLLLSWVLPHPDLAFQERPRSLQMGAFLGLLPQTSCTQTALEVRDTRREVCACYKSLTPATGLHSFLTGAFFSGENWNLFRV